MQQAPDLLYAKTMPGGGPHQVFLLLTLNFFIHKMVHFALKCFLKSQSVRVMPCLTSLMTACASQCSPALFDNSFDDYKPEILVTLDEHLLSIGCLLPPLLFSIMVQVGV